METSVPRALGDLVRLLKLLGGRTEEEKNKMREKNEEQREKERHRAKGREVEESRQIGTRSLAERGREKRGVRA